MRYEYTRTASHSYMIVRDAGYAHADYIIQMLANNRIPGLLDMKEIAENGSSEYWYDITGLQPFDCLGAGGRVGRDRLCMLIRNICDVKLALERYLLDAEDLVYDRARIFQDRKTEKLLFCYIPGLKEQQTNGMLTLMEGILEHLDHNDPGAVRTGYEIYESCAAGEAGIDRLLACISRPEPAPVKENQAEPFHFAPEQKAGDVMRVSEGRNRPLSKEYELQEEPHRLRMPFPVRRRRKKDGFDDWTEDDFAELNEIGRWDKKPEPVRAVRQKDRPTELFSDTAVQGGLRLLYKGEGNERDLRPQKFPYLIGKKEGHADGILNAGTVSRVHAKIYQEGGGYYLEDANSTNGTYVNGELLPCNTPYPLRQGDRILFGDEAFQVALLP